jgi:TRAP-type mannitol/chloroaromatic compound transport system permease small subunit
MDSSIIYEIFRRMFIAVVCVIGFILFIVGFIMYITNASIPHKRKNIIIHDTIYIK